MRWYVRRTDPAVLYDKVAHALTTWGATISGEGHYPGSSGVTFPFLVRRPSLLRGPYISLRAGAFDKPNDDLDKEPLSFVDLDCYTAVVDDTKFGRYNLKVLIAGADVLYNSISPIFGCGHDHTYRSPELDHFLRTGLPVDGQFIYVGRELVDRVDWSELRQRRCAITTMPDGGIRVENPGPPLYPTLDL